MSAAFNVFGLSAINKSICILCSTVKIHYVHIYFTIISTRLLPLCNQWTIGWWQFEQLSIVGGDYAGSAANWYFKAFHQVPWCRKHRVNTIWKYKEVQKCWRNVKTKIKINKRREVNYFCYISLARFAFVINHSLQYCLALLLLIFLDGRCYYCRHFSSVIYSLVWQKVAAAISFSCFCPILLTTTHSRASAKLYEAVNKDRFVSRFQYKKFQEKFLLNLST